MLVESLFILVLDEKDNLEYAAVSFDIWKQYLFSLTPNNYASLSFQSL